MSATPKCDWVREFLLLLLHLSIDDSMFCHFGITKIDIMDFRWWIPSRSYNWRLESSPLQSEVVVRGDVILLVEEPPGIPSFHPAKPTTLPLQL